MAKRKKRNATTWSACKVAIQNWPVPGLRALLHELYELSDENRRFLHARLLLQASAQILDDAERALRKLISCEAVFNDRFSHRDAKRVVDQFAKAIDDTTSVAELLMIDVEISFEALSDAGDFEPLIDHLYASLDRLEKLLDTLPPTALPPLAERATTLASRWGAEFGYGISDELNTFAAELQERLKKQ